MSNVDGTPVYCQKCGRQWTTRAQKKAICTNKDCKSTRIYRSADNTRFNETSDFIAARTKTAEKMTAPLQQFAKEQSAEEPAGMSAEEKTYIKDLFQDDGKTPKVEPSGIKSILEGLPKPSDFLVSSVQNLSLFPARILGAHWIMSREEAEMIASAAIPALKEVGINLNQLDPKWALAAAFAIYALPKALITFFGAPQSDEPPTPPDVREESTEFRDSQFSPPPHVRKPITHREKVESEFEDFRDKYGGSLDEAGRDLHADARSIKKPRLR